MTRSTTRILTAALFCGLLAGASGCAAPAGDDAAVPEVSRDAVPPPPLADATPARPDAPAGTINVPKLADKTIAELDRLFEKMQEGKTVEPAGEFRLYRVAGHSKGLAVRFYGGRAKSFNLVADKSFPDAKSALRELFGIDVGAAAPVRSAEPLTEQYRGTFGGVGFAKVSAKRAGTAQGFIFVLAEVGK